ncbi:MAG: major tail protein [Butyrivibrio sp.]|nr:major tail protein [Acetatifactor muris]MCM1560960.1 major tail protein [Butyrivibrio sp.]
MANFGLSRPIIAKYNVETGTYSGAIKCGSAMNTSVTPNYNSAPLYADNMLKEQVEEFSNAKVELGVDRVPIKAAKLLFGHKITDEGEETQNTEDSGSYVGYGFITAEVKNGEKIYRACFLTKVKFSEGAESYQTKGDSIQFSTPTLSGTATGNKNKEWRYKSPYFNTEEECDKWILGKMGLTKIEDEDAGSAEGAEPGGGIEQGGGTGEEEENGGEDFV